MRGDVLALSDGRNPIAFAVIDLFEQKFFGSPRTFERNVLRKIKSKEI